MVKVSVFITVILLQASYAMGQLTAVDSLKQELSLQSGDEKTATLRLLIDEYQHIDPDSAMFYGRLLFEHASKEDNEEGLLFASSHIANALFNKGKYKAALKELQPFLSGSDMDSGFEAGLLLQTAGNCYASLGLYKPAAEYYLKSKKIFTELDNRERLIVANNNLGAIYIRLGDYDAALEIFRELDELGGDNPGRITRPVNLGFIYSGLNQPDKAESYFLEALRYGDSVTELRGKAIASYNLADLYRNEQKFDKALEYYDRSKSFYNELDNEAQQVNPELGIGETFLLMNDLSRAEEAALRAKELAEEYETLTVLNKAYNLLSRIYEKEGDYKEAYRYSRKNYELSDSLNVNLRNQELDLLQAQYDFEQREEVLLAREREQQANLDKQTIIIYGILALLLISLVSFFLVYRSYRLKESANQKLQETNRVKNRLFSIIAHDLRGPLSSLYGIVSLIEMNAASQERMKELLPAMVTRFKHTSDLLNNLLHWAKSQMNGYKVLPEKFDLKKVIEKNVELLAYRFKDKGISISVDTHSSQMVFADPNMIDLVVLNLLSNAVKYCHPGDQVNIRFESGDGHIKCYVNDTGVGIPEEAMSKLFTNNFYSTNGTRNENGTGLGLMLCKDFIHRNNGEIWAESEMGKGSTFGFSLPTSENETESD